ncbi:MAG: hypothetical protein WCK53_02445 [Methanomicrobiales archaeon]
MNRGIISFRPFLFIIVIRLAVGKDRLFLLETLKKVQGRPGPEQCIPWRTPSYSRMVAGVHDRDVWRGNLPHIENMGIFTTGLLFSRMLKKERPNIRSARS